MPEFIPGLKLAELFYLEAVKPILKREFPKLRYAIGRIGSGSDVLGFDTERSADHDWGARIELFLSESDYRKYQKSIKQVLSQQLPPTIHGYPTHFSDPDKNNVRVKEEAKGKTINHRVEIYTLKSFFKGYLHWNPTKKIDIYDWLTFPEQKLATIRNGKIFHDDIGVESVRKKLDYYPQDIWQYLLAAQWTRIAQEEPFVARCGDVGDELGSRIIATRLVNDAMRLCFLMEKQYAPYSKWFGTAFLRLTKTKSLVPIMNNVLDAKNWKEREKHLSLLYIEIAKMHNQLGITKSMPEIVSLFHDRPYLVIHGEEFATEILKSIKDKNVKNIKLPIGSVNQFSNSTDILENDTTKFKSIYR